MAAQHTLHRAVGGVEGYRRLARLVARAFYSGEAPPREEDDVAAGPLAPKSRQPKHSFAGLAVLLVDYLASAKVDGYSDETTMAGDLRLSQKNIRKALRYLEAERMVASETVKFSFKRRNAEEVDDPEVEERKRHETHVFWCLDYPRMVDALRLRLAKVREVLRRQGEDVGAVQRYVCPRCGAQYSSLDAGRLIDPASGTFRCEECHGELAEHVEGPGGGPGAEASRKERQAYFKGLLARLEAQLRPIVEQLERLKDVETPDYGALQDWYQGKKEEAECRARRLEAARRRAAAAGGEGMSEEQLLDWAERAEVVVALPGAEGGGSASAALAPGKELPVWFRTEETPSASVAASEELHSVAGGMAGAASAEAQRLQLEQQYLQQYLLQVQAAGAASGAADEYAGGKRLKTEAGRAEAGKAEEQEGAQQQLLEPKPEGAAEAGGGGQHKAGAAADEEVEWEEVE